MSRLETHKKIIDLFLSEYETTPEGEKEIKLKNFALFLSKNKVLRPQDGDQFFALMNDSIEERAGTPKALVTVQSRMSKDNLSTLKEKLKTMFQVKDVFIEEKIDQRILGGMKVEIKGKVYTDTIQRKINQLKVTLNAS